MTTYRTTWYIEVEADSEDEARTLLADALDACDDVPAAIYDTGDFELTGETT